MFGLKKLSLSYGVVLALIIVDVAAELGVRSQQTGLGDDIHCYSIPYGAIGFVQHLSTYYKIAVLHRIRRPAMPWRRLEAPGKWNTIITSVQLLVNSIISFVTMGRCNKSWELICMVLWKFMLAITLGIWSFQASRIAGRLAKGEDYENGGRDNGKLRVSAWWLLIYVAALAIGLPGLFTLVKNNYSLTLQELTGGIWGTCGALIFLRLFCGCCNQAMPEDGRMQLCPEQLGGWGIDQDEDASTGVIQSVFGIVGFIVVCAALYSDWALAIMVQNVSGVPHGTTTSALYWIYFLGKELPFLAL